MIYRRQVLIAGLLAYALTAFTPYSLAQSNTAAEVLVTGDVIEKRAKEQDLTSNALQDYSDLEAFIDGVMAGQFESKKLGGATLSVVHNGEIILKKGYGFSDMETRSPVNPDKTLFRPGSISKLFTWTAVMQQVEEGKIDLDADINIYLTQFQIPDAYDAPITMKHLMAHSAGFEEKPLVGLFRMNEEELLPLSEYLKQAIPDRVRAPGKSISYSNYSTALAGLIVANVSGRRYEDYIDEHILEPLGMDYATFQEPLPEALLPHMVKGYKSIGAKNVVRDFEFISNVGPAGALSASATSMAQFMIDHLNPESSVLLKPETMQQMHGQLFANDPRFPGNAHGFWEWGERNPPIIWHNGGTSVFMSWLFLVPGENFGLFVSYNSPDGGAASGEIFQAVIDRYFPDNISKTSQWEHLEGSVERAALVAGTYRSHRRSYSLIDKIAAAQPITFADHGDGSISIGSTVLVEKEPFFFVDPYGYSRVSFETDKDGKVTGVLMGSGAADKVGPLESVDLHAVIIVLMLLAALSSIWSTVRRPDQAFGQGAQGSFAQITILTVNGLSLAFIVLFVMMLISQGIELLFGYPGSLPTLLALPVLVAVLLLPLAWLCISVWRDGVWTFWRRLKFTANTVLAALFILVLNYWNILGWKI
jgi:CubicO group peptidase (beta-lactamase class C family)